MGDFSHNHENQISKIDLLSNTRLRKNWFARLTKNTHCWRAFSGRWETESNKTLVCHGEPEVITGENISVIGSRDWNRFTFQVTFNVLTPSTKPPEGGAILYFLFKNLNNYYSLHFCLIKLKIELIKRTKGIWNTLAEKDYEIQTGRDYSVTIDTASGKHQCRIDGRDIIVMQDTDILNGCVGIGAKYCNVEFSNVSIALP